MTDNNRIILLMAKTISLVFTPFYLPLVALIVLFMVSYLSMLPLIYKGMVLLIVWLFTCLIPTTMIHLYRRYQGWSLLKLVSKEGRFVPYIISIGCYFTCFYIMNAIHLPHFMSSIVVAALAIQILGAIINNWWKISTHTAAIGGTTGALLAFSLIFGFNPLWWLCILLLIAGLLGTSRMVLRQHSLSQVVGGFALGTICAVLGIAYL